MISIIFSLIVSVIDLMIFRKYLEVFIGNREISYKISVLILLTGAFISSMLNQLKSPMVNLITTVLLLCALSLQYISPIKIKLVLVSMYIGIGFITEPLGLLILRLFPYKEPYDFQSKYYFAVILIEAMRLLLVHIVCKMKLEKMATLPKGISRMLIVVPAIGVLNCCLIIQIAMSEAKLESILLCITIIIAVVASNYFLFNIFNKFNNVINQKHEYELYIQEMRHKEAYYREVQECNEYVQDIKHDLKNRLGLLYDCMDNINDLARDKIKELFLELEHVDKRIYTENAVLNSILKIKLTIAKELGIKTDIKIQVPMDMKIDCGDLGIIYGNLLDNAIEACERTEPESRYISLENKYIEGSLILIIKNSKPAGRNEDLKTSKKDKRAHGRGINSVRRVVEKYNGTIKFEDMTEDFEVSAIFYGI